MSSSGSLNHWISSAFLSVPSAFSAQKSDIVKNW
jgi:hypothetical protein